MNSPAQDTVLVVDDEATVLNFCKLILTRGGLQVLTATSGPDAVRLVEHGETRIRLALLDVVMPGMTGFELAARLRQADSNIDILLMTGFSVNEVRNIAGGDCPYRIIWKPFKAESLLRMVQTVLDASPRKSP